MDEGARRTTGGREREEERRRQKCRKRSVSRGEAEKRRRDAYLLALDEELTVAVLDFNKTAGSVAHEAYNLASRPELTNETVGLGVGGKVENRSMTADVLQCVGRVSQAGRERGRKKTETDEDGGVILLVDVGEL